MGKAIRPHLLGRLRGGLLASKPWQQLAAHIGREPQTGGWVFVMGCYNSGTTLLAELVARHPIAAGMPSEGSALSHLLPTPEDFGWPRLWYKCEDQIRCNLGAREARMIRRQWGLATRSAADYLVEKSVSNMLRVEFLRDHFPGARFITLVRNGYAVAEGIRRRACPPPEHAGPDGRYPIDWAARQWVRSLDVMEEHFAHQSDYINITYEELVSAPTKTMDNIFDFLGWPSAPQVTRAPWTFQGQTRTITNDNPSAVSRLTHKEIALIDEIAHAHLRAKGYEAP